MSCNSFNGCPSAKAIESRIRRLLAREGLLLHKSRGEITRNGLGEYYITSAHNTVVEAYHCTLEGLAREHGLPIPFASADT